jgi:hypothetical protein
MDNFNFPDASRVARCRRRRAKGTQTSSTQPLQADRTTQKHVPGHPTPHDTHNARRDRCMHAVDFNKCSCAHHSDKGRNLLGRSKRDKPERHLCACTGRSRGCEPSDSGLCPRPGPLAKWRSHAAFLIPPIEGRSKKNLGMMSQIRSWKKGGRFTVA